MATITTAIVPALIPRGFASPGLVTGGSAPTPVQRLIFLDDTTVALKDAANDSFVTITVTLPPAYFYRVVSVRIMALSVAAADFIDFEPAMGFSITEDAVERYQFALHNQILAAGVGGESAVVNQISVINNVATWFAPIVDISQYLVDATEGISQIIGHWLDLSADITQAMQILTRIEVDKFTVQQANQAPLNYSLLTYR